MSSRATPGETPFYVRCNMLAVNSHGQFIYHKHWTFERLCLSILFF